MTKKKNEQNKWTEFDRIIKKTKINGLPVCPVNRFEVPYWYKCPIEDCPTFKTAPEEERRIVREMYWSLDFIKADLKKARRKIFWMRIFATVIGIFSIALNVHCILFLPNNPLKLFNFLILFPLLYQLFNVWQINPLRRFKKNKDNSDE